MTIISEKYTGLMPADGNILSVPITQSMDEVISVMVTVSSSKGLGITPNTNNILNNYAVAMKDYEIILQCGENAVNIQGMPVSVTVLYSE